MFLNELFVVIVKTLTDSRVIFIDLFLGFLRHIKLYLNFELKLF